MSVITSIKPQKSKKRVNVYLDDKFGFGIDLDNFVLLKLKVDQELTEKEVEGIIRKSGFQKVLDKMLMFATLRPRSEREFKSWLIKKKVHESLHSDLFKKLKHFDLLDDEKFAKWWVDQRQNFRPKPKRVLKGELRMKGIPPDIIENVLGEEKIDEAKMAGELIAKKEYKWKNLPEKEAWKKKVAYLAQKGFDWEVIERVLDTGSSGE